MTQFTTYRGFSLRHAPVATRVLITSFLLTVSVALAVGILNYRVRTGLTPSGSAAWYLGNEAVATGDAVLYEKTPLELLDATHPHLFGQAFLFFVLCHLFALVAISSRVKLTVYVAAFGSVLVDSASPWLIRYVSPGFTWLQIAGTMVMTLTFAVLVLLPLREMWLPGRGSRGAARRGVVAPEPGSSA